MAEIGINVDRIGTYDPRDLAKAGARYARCVAIRDVDLRDWIGRAHDAGVMVLLVIARESIDDLAYHEAAALYADRYAGIIDALQVGNESDHSEGQSSWTMNHVDLNVLLRTFRHAFPSTYLVGPGLVSGQPGYVDGIDLEMVDAIGVHIYGQGVPGYPSPYGFPDHAGILLDKYRAKAPDKGLWMTEWGVMESELGPTVAAEYMDRMCRFLAGRSDVQVATIFAWSDAMVPTFGLLTDYGARKPMYDAFARVALGQGAPSPQPAPAPTKPRFQEGFAKLKQAAPELVGRPLKDERGPFPGASFQPTTEGICLWIESKGIMFVQKDTGRTWLFDEASGRVQEAA